MKNKLFTIIALALVFISIMLLAAAIQYSSGLIGVRSQPQQTYTSDINITGQSNHTDSGAAASSNNDSSASLTVPELSLSPLPEIVKALGGLPDLLDNSPYSPLILIAILIALILLAIIGYILWRRRKRPQMQPAARLERVQERPDLDYHEGDYSISFPQIRAPLPAIWGINEKLDVVVQDKTGDNNSLSLLVDYKVVGHFRAEHGSAHAVLELEKGDHRITVSPENAPGSHGSSWADIRIVDYREEIVRMFNEMYSAHMSGHDGTGQELTARELELAMRKGMPEKMIKSLGDAIMLFEYANYSLHDIQRKDFEDMYISRMGLMPSAGGQTSNVI